MRHNKSERYNRARTISDADDVDLPAELSEESDVERNYHNRLISPKPIAPSAPFVPVEFGEDGEPAACDEAMLCCKVLVLCLCWYTVSSANNIIGKRLLMYYPYPLTATMAQLLSTAICSLPLAMHWQVPHVNWKLIGWRYGLTVIIPLGFGKFIAAASAHVSLWRVPVSYAHTVKASMPIFVVFLSRVLLHEKQTWLVYMSLSPIVTGVIVATMTELSFDTIGLMSALLATLSFSLQNVFSKKCLRETGMHHIRLLSILAQLATVMLLPFWLISDVMHVIQHWPRLSVNTDWNWVAMLLFMDGMLNFAQNVIAFTMIALVSPLSYAVANASKRIAVILMSLLVLQNPVTPANCIGMGLAILGVLMYNKAKYDQNRRKQREKVLPYVKSDAVLSNSDVVQHHYHNNNQFHNSASVGNGLNNTLMHNNQPHRVV